MKKVLFALALGLCAATPSSYAQGYISGYIIKDSLSAPATPTYKVWLIVLNSGVLSAVDSQTVTAPNMYWDTPYQFDSVMPGTYRIKAQLMNGPSSGTSWVPTYGDSSLYWNTANSITKPAGNVSSKNIWMKSGPAYSGPGFVGGNVSAGANKGTGAGLPGMTVFILNSADKLVNATTTDASGNFSFSNLPTGTYKVRPEDMNYTTTPITVNVTNGQATVNNVDFERSKSQKTITPKSSGIASVSKNSGLAVYPNPASSSVTVKWNTPGNANIRITDIAGKTVLTTQGVSGTQVNVSDLQKGTYFITIEGTNVNAAQKLSIQ